MPDRHLIRDVLLAPQMVSQLSLRQWDLLIRQGRRANLLARLAAVLEASELLEQVPDAPRQHLLSAKQLALRQAIAVRWEVHCIGDALRDVDHPVTLLKGAAYLMAGLPCAEGRIFSDVDILVPKACIGEVESSLMLHGWRSQQTTAYDQRYYRQWMHEIPPMTHIRRGTTIDVHHAILPETARLKVNTPRLLQGLTSLPEFPSFAVLAPVEMVLHSATHLFHEGEFENGLRDLFDLDLLLRHFSSAPDFWSQLVPRAQALGLSRPLSYALRYTAMYLGTPIPEEVRQAAWVSGGVPAWRQVLMDACFSRVLRSMHPSCDERGSGIARLLMYVRSHWIRMPMHLLMVHLLRKAVIRPPMPESPAPQKDDKPKQDGVQQ